MLVAGDTGKCAIVDAKAEVVRRIFRHCVDGRTPRDIAHELYTERIVRPRGRAWNASTTNGNMQRGYGIVNNELYAVRLAWNKVRGV